MTYSAKKALVGDLLDDFKEATSGGFLEWVYDVLFELDEDAIPSDELIEGTGEKQIDVIRVDDDTENARARISVLQTKETNGFSSDTVILIGNGISTMLEAKRSTIQKLTNKTLVGKALEVRDILKRYGYGSVELDVFYATLGDSTKVSKETKEEIESLETKWSNQSFARFGFHILGASELYDLWLRRNTSDRSINQDINIVYDVNRPSIIEFSTESYKAVVCTISGQEIARLAALEPKDAIFDMNVRGHLGSGGRVNSNILHACTDEDDAKTFWFKNNGITMVCSHLDISKDPDEPIVKVKNVQIVNGCQTSVTLREASASGNLQHSVHVLAKIFQLADTNLINKIVLATNNQNSIVSRDLYANDECQGLIQQTLKTQLNLFYERKRGEARSAKRARSETIDSEKAGQAYLAIKKKLPTVSRAQKYRIYESDLYADIFQRSAPLQLALCYFLYEYCKKAGAKNAKLLEKSSDERSLLTYGVFHLSRIFAYFVFKSETLPNDPDQLIETIAKLRTNDKKFEPIFQKSVRLCLRVLRRAKAVSANNYFKSQLAQQQITEAISRL